MVRNLSDNEWAYSPLDLAAPVPQALIDHRVHVCSPGDIAEWLLGSSGSAAHRTRILSAKNYGLINVGHLEIALTALGYWICQPEWTKQARVTAFMNVEGFRQFAEKFNENQLPPPDELEQVLRDLGATEKQAQRIRQVMTKSARFAGILNKDWLALPDGWQDVEYPPLPRYWEEGIGSRPVSSGVTIVDMFANATNLPVSVWAHLDEFAARKQWTEADFEAWMEAFRATLRLARADLRKPGGGVTPQPAGPPPSP